MHLIKSLERTLIKSSLSRFLHLKMLPRLFSIALALLAFSDVAFGRIGNSEPNVFAPRPVGNTSNLKVGSHNHEGRTRSLSKHGKLDEVAEKLKHDGRAQGLWKELNKGHQLMDAFGVEGHKKLDEAKPVHKKNESGKLRKLKAEKRRRLSEEESDAIDTEPVPNFVIP